MDRAGLTAVDLLDLLGGAVVYWHWFALAVLLVGIEILVPGVAFLWLAIAAAILGVALLAWADMPFGLQLVAFGLLSVAALWFGRRWFARHEEPTDHPTLNRRAAQHVGREFALDEPMRGGRCRLKVGDSWWSAELAGAPRDLPAGTRVRVTGVDGVTLKVEAV